MLKLFIIILCIVSLSSANPIVRALIPKKPKIKVKKRGLRGSKLKYGTLKRGGSTLSRRRRITKLEKELITSKGARKTRFNGRTVVKRKVFPCSQSNIALMLKGKAPLGFDSRKINLHHLKQQQFGTLVELSASEHTQHSKVLHRYTKTSEILDRNSAYNKFRRDWWRARATDCISRKR